MRGTWPMAAAMHEWGERLRAQPPPVGFLVATARSSFRPSTCALGAAASTSGGVHLAFFAAFGPSLTEGPGHLAHSMATTVDVVAGPVSATGLLIRLVDQLHDSATVSDEACVRGLESEFSEDQLLDLTMLHRLVPPPPSSFTCPSGPRSLLKKEPPPSPRCEVLLAGGVADRGTSWSTPGWSSWSLRVPCTVVVVCQSGAGPARLSCSMSLDLRRGQRRDPIVVVGGAVRESGVSPASVAWLADGVAAKLVQLRAEVQLCKAVAAGRRSTAGGDRP